MSHLMTVIKVPRCVFTEDMPAIKNKITTMHELTLCQSAFDIIEQQAQANNVKRVTGVWLEIGALSCIEESAVHFCFEIVCRGSVAEGCALHITTQPAQAWCWDCSQAITVSAHDAGCPHCQSHNLRVDSGDSMQIKQIEIE
ncbi:hydrogenase maturation nickel metallochaperone HypA [Hafnia alvei]|nr:hydrogenase maturation nickel metallochaperone HypA [Hafnia alvei]TBM13819.1 hydrogenase maturation nickel metallochaperone HypA [Hafnia alvei]TBM16143.1 hydrogenase maturation nickel metallochaperone HypA [Hafnia alvei]